CRVFVALKTDESSTSLWHELQRCVEHASSCTEHRHKHDRVIWYPIGFSRPKRSLHRSPISLVLSEGFHDQTEADSARSPAEHFTVCVLVAKHAKRVLHDGIVHHVQFWVIYRQSLHLVLLMLPNGFAALYHFLAIKKACSMQALFSVYLIFFR